MLDPESVDLTELCTAFDDHSPGVTWWIDPISGVIRHQRDVDRPRTGWLRIEPVGSHEGYRDMADFVSGVHDRRAADLLDRAISGRGAFRRFKDTLHEFPDLRDRWFRFRDARARRRALHWLAVQELVDPAAAERLAARHPDPIADQEVDLPTAVAADLGTLYGNRLERVLVFGAWATGEAQAAFALQLLVVLADVRSRWDELHRMDEVLWRHTERAGVTVTAVPVTATELDAPATPLVRRAVASARWVV